MLAPAAVVMGAAMTAIAAVPLLPVSLHGVPAQLAGSCGLLFVAGLGGGVLLVPLEAFIQARPPADRKGHVIAAANFTAFLGVMASGLVFVGLSRIVTPAEGFGLLGGLTILVGLAVWMRVKRHA